MKKTIIITIITILIALAGVAGWSYYVSFHAVTFISEKSDFSLDVFKSNDQQVGSLNSSRVISLQSGDYYYVVRGANYTTTHYAFSVGSRAQSLSVTPDNSVQYLANQLNSQSATIQAAVTTAYPTVLPQYTFFSQQVFKTGDWYGAVLINKASTPNNIKDVYRVILHKENGIWKMMHYPEILVTKANFPSVPSDVLNAVNDLVYS